MLISIFTDNFLDIMFLMVFEFAIWTVIFLLLGRWFRPLRLKTKHLKWFSAFMDMIFVLTFAGLFFLQDFYHDQTFIENGKVPPIKLNVEIVSLVFAYIYTLVDHGKLTEIFQKRHKIILTENDDVNESK